MIKCGFSKSADDTKLEEWLVHHRVMLLSRGILTGWKKWSDRSPMKFSKERCKVLQLRKNNPMHQDLWGHPNWEAA